MKRTVGPFGEEVVFPLRATPSDQPGPSPQEVRGPCWRRSSRGLFVPADTPRTPEQRVAEASMVVPAHGGITGWGALRWSGGRWFEGTTHGGRVELSVSIVSPGAGVRAQPGIEVFRSRWAAAETVTHDGLRLATPVAATVFAMCHASSETEAVVVADMSALSDLCSICEADEYLATHPRMRGIALARRALSLAHENSWSPMETRLRILCRLTAGLPPLHVNAPVFDLHGRHVGTPDLLDVEAGLVIEYDGAEFHGGARRLKDQHREDDLRGVGLSYMTVLKGEFGHRSKLTDRLRRARRQALAERRSPRRWTVAVPPGWELYDTVARRRRTRP